jgi:hypothetical protein
VLLYLVVLRYIPIYLFIYVYYLFINNVQYHGPIENERAIKLLVINLDIAGLACIYYGCSSQEFAFLVYATMILACLWQFLSEKRCFEYFTYRYLTPKRKLLTNEEYEREGQEYTAKALSRLRDFCKSTDCNSWKVLRRLKKLDRFLEFIDSGGHHLTQDEMTDYENYSFRLYLISEGRYN